MDILSFITGYIRSAQITDIIDIAVVATFTYVVLKRIKGTSAERLLKGIGVLLLLMFLASVFQLNSIIYLLENLTQVGLISLVVVFQPELRKMLEKMGKTKFYKSAPDEEMSEGELIINAIVDACLRLSESKEGALIVFEKEDSIREVIASGVQTNAKVSSELIRNIFYPKAPLHDGAMIIQDGKIVASACILPLSKNQNISKDLGTRHRAAVGMTENTDALCVIVSEETGAISVSSKGMLKRHLSKEILKKLLTYELIRKEEKQDEKGLGAFLDKSFYKLVKKQKLDKED